MAKPETTLTLREYRGHKIEIDTSTGTIALTIDATEVVTKGGFASVNHAYDYARRRLDTAAKRRTTRTPPNDGWWAEWLREQAERESQWYAR